MCLGRRPHQSAGLGNRARHIHPAAEHVEILHTQRGHFTPTQAGVGEEPHHCAVTFDGGRERDDCAWARYPRSVCLRLGSRIPSHGFRGIHRSSTAAPITWRSSPNAFSMPGPKTVGAQHNSMRVIVGSCCAAARLRGHRPSSRLGSRMKAKDPARPHGQPGPKTLGGE